MTAGATVGWGIVGTGGIAETTIGDLRLTSNVSVRAVASRDPRRARHFAQRHDIPRAHDSYTALFDDDSVDVVYIGTPSSSHAEIAIAALEAGKAVLVEKPFATTEEEAREMVAAADRAGRFLMEAMWMRFNPAICRMLADVADGAIGDVTAVNAGFGIPFPPTWNVWRPDLGGGALLELGVYPVSLAHLLLGAPEQVFGVGSMRADGLDVTASVHLRYGDERFAQVVTSLAGFVSPGASIGGTGGFIAFDEPFMSAAQFRLETPMRGEPRIVRTELEGKGYVPMFRAVSDGVAAGLTEHPMRPLADTIDVLATLDDVRRQLAAASGMAPRAI